MIDGKIFLQISLRREHLWYTRQKRPRDRDADRSSTFIVDGREIQYSQWREASECACMHLRRHPHVHATSSTSLRELSWRVMRIRGWSEVVVSAEHILFHVVRRNIFVAWSSSFGESETLERLAGGAWLTTPRMVPACT